jgi:hypothetical protein
MLKNTIPTTLGIVIIAAMIAVYFALANSSQASYKSPVSAIHPENVKVTNISDDSFSVSWVTDAKTNGHVIVEDKSGKTKKITPPQTQPRHTHHINVNGLSASSTYLVKIFSENKEFREIGKGWVVETAPKISFQPLSRVIYGKIKGLPHQVQSDAIVYAAAGEGRLLSATTSEDGSWFIPVSNARSYTLDSYIFLNETKKISILVDAGPLGTAAALIKAADYVAVPPIVLGEYSDFTHFGPVNKTNPPPASIIATGN